MTSSQRLAPLTALDIVRSASALICLAVTCFALNGCNGSDRPADATARIASKLEELAKAPDGLALRLRQNPAATNATQPALAAQ